MSIKIDFTEKFINISVPSEFYNLEILQKCFYWYGSEFIVDIDKDNDHYKIKLEPQNGKLDNPKKNKLTAKIKNDIIDHKTRDIVLKETKNVRDLLIAKAFANTDEFDEKPPGDITDPVGFEL